MGQRKISSFFSAPEVLDVCPKSEDSNRHLYFSRYNYAEGSKLATSTGFTELTLIPPGLADGKLRCHKVSVP